MTMDNGEGRWSDDESRPGIDPDQIVHDFEIDDAENLEAREDEATDIALAAPGGIVFGERYDDEGFDAEHNP
ncbi:hypothetical protein [Leifsonia sp. NPDC058230]|uniref:hypothetical protein n=1 Tax=Leifsonia sp. NPDC058230 TaxID=3346391 RepID=UPI0036DACA64